jgi:two-component system, sensor histidine kinase YesM
LIITIAAVLLFYAIGMYLNTSGMTRVRRGLQEQFDAGMVYMSKEIEREISNFLIFEQELANDQELLRYVITYDILSDYQRIKSINTLSGQLYRIKRFSTMVESACILLPTLGYSIVTEQTTFAELDPVMWEAFLNISNAKRSAVGEWQGMLWLLYTCFEGTQPFYITAIGISPQSMLSRMKEMRSSDEIDIILLREDGSTLVSTLSDEALQEYANEPKKNYLSSESEILSLGIRVIGYNPIEDSMESLYMHRIWIWILSLLSALLLCIYLLYYRCFILRPLNEIFESARRMEETGDFQIENTNKGFDDIYAQFTGMVDRIKELAARVYEEQYRAKKAELIQLQIQINPHFLYNSLFLIYRMARTEGDEEIAKLAMNMSTYYRYITETPQREVTLQDEISHILNYLEIQKTRFEPRITIEASEPPEEIAHEIIPSLILQPLVENAFEHGVKDIVSNGMVVLQYEYTEDTFSVIISDNGGRMDETNVEALIKALEDHTLPDGSALVNLKRRLELQYGAGNGLSLSSVNGGLCARLTFPRGGNGKHDVPAGSR